MVWPRFSRRVVTESSPIVHRQLDAAGDEIDDPKAEPGQEPDAEDAKRAPERGLAVQPESDGDPIQQILK